MLAAGDRRFWRWQAFIGGIRFDWARNLRYRVYRQFFKSCGRNLRIHDDVLIKFPSRIVLGDNITINKGCLIGGTGELIIGDDTQIGSGTKIYTTSHRYDRIDIPIVEQGMTDLRVEIGPDVWFGFNCIVLPGATIGRSCVVGAGSVVTAGTYPDYSVIVGNPGKVIRDRRQSKS